MTIGLGSSSPSAAGSPRRRWPCGAGASAVCPCRRAPSSRKGCCSHAGSPVSRAEACSARTSCRALA
jgi:hypothetical protein